MPYKRKLVGIYSIVTPNGSTYVGSSTHILVRWGEHRYMLRNNRHHSIRLQRAYNKHGQLLTFSVIEECAVELLNEREQFHINKLKAKLNTVEFISNVWLNQETREKFRKIHSSPEWRQQRSEITLNYKGRWIGVTCSDGRVFANMADAARAFGIRTSGIRHLASTQITGKLGVRFRLTADSWRPELSLSERLIATREKNGNRHHTESAKIKMSLAKGGKGPSRDAINKSIESRIRSVLSINRITGEKRIYPSITDAAKIVHPSNWKCARGQIVKACTKVKKNAYGFLWEYAEQRATVGGK